MLFCSSIQLGKNIPLTPPAFYEMLLVPPLMGPTGPGSPKQVMVLMIEADNHVLQRYAPHQQGPYQAGCMFLTI
jgi:hypothetical protein